MLFLPTRTGSRRNNNVACVLALYIPAASFFAISHILCTFAVQSRAFLSQLSVTGDESGFFMPFCKGNCFVCVIPLVSNIFSFPLSNCPFFSEEVQPHVINFIHHHCYVNMVMFYIEWFNWMYQFPLIGLYSVVSLYVLR